MTTSKVVLIDPSPRKRTEQHDIRDHPHLGSAYTAAYLRSKGANCSPIDGKRERLDIEGVRRRLGLAILGKLLFGVFAVVRRQGERGC